MKRVLITGITRQDGSYLSELLLANEHKAELGKTIEWFEQNSEAVVHASRPA